MRKSIGILAYGLMVLILTAHAQTNESDRQEIQKEVDKFYTTLSFTDGEWKQAEDLKELFFADSRLIANFGNAPQVWTTEQYITSVRNNITKQGINGVEEKEIFEKTDLFGKVAHRLSTYEIRFTIKGKETFRTGINFIQLIKANDSWKINSIVWDRESDELKVPSQYKPVK